MKTNLPLINVLLFLACATTNLFSQNIQKFENNDIFQTSFFIENKGQYKTPDKASNLIDFYTTSGATNYYISKTGMHIILNSSALKEEKGVNDNKEEKKVKRKNIHTLAKIASDEVAEEGEKSYEYFHEDIELHWLNTNPNPTIQKEEKSNHYFSYGNEEYISYGYKKVTYKNIYNKIDLVYEIASTGGVKYSLILHPGAKIEDIQYEYKGDNISVENRKTSLLIKNPLEDLEEKNLVAYTAENKKIDIEYKLEKNKLGFISNSPLNSNASLTIDPWIGSISTLAVNNKGFDVDYDFSGNLYVYGGGNAAGGDYFKIAKYNSAGVLQWTFMGFIVSPPWSTNPTAEYAGNFLVNKENGSVYTGQGYGFSASLIRLRTDGTYDSFISEMVSGSPGGEYEIWEMNYNCTTGEIINMGGSTEIDTHIGVVDTSTGACVMHNITGFFGSDQDIASSCFDLSNNLFVIFADVLHPSLDNHIALVNSTYTAATWIAPTGYLTLNESDNKPFYNIYGANGLNALAANNSYLFYYDGINLKAFDKATGAAVGTATTISGYVAKMQSGIYVDNCNHIYVGGANGNIKVFTFDGSTFNAESDILIPGHSSSHIFDVKYSPSTDMLYISGDSLVATINPSFYCSDTGLRITAIGVCPSDAYVTIDDYNPSLSYSFIWIDSLTDSTVRQVLNVHRTSDTLHGLIPGHYYSITVIEKGVCSNIKSVKLVSSNLSLSDTLINFCLGESVRYHGVNYSTAGVYEDTFHIGVCDSVARLRVALFVSSSDTVDKTICAGDSLFCGRHYQKIPGIYADTFASFGAGCDSNFFTVLHLYPVSSFVVHDTDICLGHTASLSVSGGVHYLWSNGDTTNSINVSPNFTSSYSVIITDSNNCASSASGTVSIFVLGTLAEAIPDTVINSGESVWLHAIYSFVDTSLLWSPNSFLSNVDSSYTLASPLETTTYVVIVTDSNGCKGMDSIQIVVNNQGSIHTASAFSPNGDGNNDYFTVFAKGLKEYAISIFNRWGELVYYSNDLNELNNLNDGWDGTFKGKIQDIGTFVYFIKAKDLKDQSFLVKGNLELMK